MDALAPSSSREQTGESRQERADRREQTGESRQERSDSLALALSPSAAWRSPVKDKGQQRGDSTATADRRGAGRSGLLDSVEQRGGQRQGQRGEQRLESSTSATPPGYEVEVGDGDESPDFFDDSDD
jgi:hypothetical protein